MFSLRPPLSFLDLWSRAAVIAGLLLAASCAANSAPPTTRAAKASAHEPPGTVVFVLTAAGEQTLANGKERATGFFLNEFYEPYRAVIAAGYTVIIATPGGKPPVVDPESVEPDYWKDQPELLGQARAFVDEDRAFANPVSLAEIRKRVDEFQGIVVPGGQGVMVDLLDDEDLHASLVELGKAGRAVGLVCHAPAILTRLPAGSSPFEGRMVTSVSGFEEFYIERFVMKGRATDRRIGRQLEQHGYDYQKGRAGKSFAVRDCNLATSQNPFSSASFNEHLLAALEVARAGGTCD